MFDSGAQDIKSNPKFRLVDVRSFAQKGKLRVDGLTDPD